MSETARSPRHAPRGLLALTLALIHQAWVSVNEQGTEAAAATAVIVGRVSLPEEVVANRPFLFFVRDRPTGAILFAGRVTDPRQ